MPLTHIANVLRLTLDEFKEDIQKYILSACPHAEQFEKVEVAFNGDGESEWIEISAYYKDNIPEVARPDWCQNTEMECDYFYSDSPEDFFPLIRAVYKRNIINIFWNEEDGTIELIESVEKEGDDHACQKKQ